MVEGKIQLSRQHPVTRHGNRGLRISRQHRRSVRGARDVIAASDTATRCLDISDNNGHRRSLLLAIAASVATVSASQQLSAEAKTAATRAAGDFCPPASTPGYVIYTPKPDATPALRAGVIQPAPSLYSFELPPTWREGKQQLNFIRISYLQGIPFKAHIP
jgi:hypothetical protein